jgi:hypothetical protein
VFVEPRFQRCRRFASRVLPPCCKVVAGPVAETGEYPVSLSATQLTTKTNSVASVCEGNNTDRATAACR